jgi:hypothetical protein
MGVLHGKTAPVCCDKGCSGRDLKLEELSVFYAGLGDVDFEFFFSQGISVEHFNGFIGNFFRNHGDKGKALRLAAIAIFDDFYRGDIPGLREEGVEFFLGG